MTKVLVTGGLGNIGIKIIEALLMQGFEVRCLDIKNKRNLNSAKTFRRKIKVFWGDITNPNDVINSIMGVDAVIHTAAILPPFSETNPGIARRVNVSGTEHLIEALECFNPDAQLIFASSVGVHGNHLPHDQPGRRIEDAFEPCDNYAGHKIECEQLLAKSNIRWTILRISACTDEKARMLDLRNLKGSMEIFLKVHPDCRIEYIHPKDVALAMVHAVGNDLAIGKRFFVGGGKKCQSNWRDLNSMRLLALGLEKPPAECFGKEGFYTEWLDTEESQSVLDFQNHDLDDYQDELEVLLKWPRRALTPIMPVVNKGIWKVLPVSHFPLWNS